MLVFGAILCLLPNQLRSAPMECQDKTTGYPVMVACDNAGVTNVTLTSALIATTTLALTTQIDAVNGTLAPSATASITFAATATWFIIANESTAPIRICPACTAAASTGLYLDGGGTASADSVSITTLTLYNQSTASATYSVLSGRKP